MTELPNPKQFFPALPGMLRKYDRLSRKSRFTGNTPGELRLWQKNTKALLQDLFGLDKMENCDASPVLIDIAEPGEDIRREHWRIQVEPDVWMTFFLLIPPGADKETPVFICPPGHNGAGKYSVAGCREYRAVAEKIDMYNYDYGWQLAKIGYIAVCPDCRGFGERREDPDEAGVLPGGLKGDCYRLSHMGEPLGIPVAGMLTWDLMRLIDWLEADSRFNTGSLGCLGFSGGGMQTLWLAALDERIQTAVISGYMYGYRDALLTLNSNCSCNYVPHLWEHLDMGDIACLIAPRSLWVQSCLEDRLNGPRGIANVEEQVAVIRGAYSLLGNREHFLYELCDGPHRWHSEHLSENLARLRI